MFTIIYITFTFTSTPPCTTLASQCAVCTDAWHPSTLPLNVKLHMLMGDHKGYLTNYVVCLVSTGFQTALSDLARQQICTACMRGPCGVQAKKALCGWWVCSR